MMIAAFIAAAVLQWEAPDGLTSFREETENCFRLDSRVDREQAKTWSAKFRKDPKAKPPVPIFAGKPYYSAIGGNEGVMLDSVLMNVKPGQCYRLSAEVRGNSVPYIWIKGFKMHPRRKFLTDCYQTRLAAGPLSPNEWRRFEIGFKPRGAEKMKVRLYVFWPVGVCYFRNIRVDEIDEKEMTRLTGKRNQ